MWAQVYAMKSEDAETIARHFFEGIICLHGCPQSILTDRGPSFTSEFLRHLLSFLNIYHNFTTPYHPCTNGRAERFVRTFKQMVTAYVYDCPQDWDLSPQLLSFAYNSSVHSSTG
jgi:transposase InsO family protein